jgi:hypothetical protein
LRAVEKAVASPSVQKLLSVVHAVLSWGEKQGYLEGCRPALRRAWAPLQSLGETLRRFISQPVRRVRVPSPFTARRFDGKIAWMLPPTR